MSNVSPEWLAAISQGRQYSVAPTDTKYAVPITPWLHPPLDERLQALIRRLGIRRKLQRQEVIFANAQAVSELVLVEQGVVARNFGMASSKPHTSAAISTPGHLGSGNLNFFTRRPVFGQYFALTRAEVTCCAKDLLLSVLSTDPKLFSLLLKHLECCTLSDRVGFALVAFAPVELRIKAFVITWAIHFAKIIEDGSDLVVKMPVPLTRNNRCLVANASSVSTDSCLKSWKDKGVWIREGDFVTFPASFFDDAYRWMRNAEENSPYVYPKTLSELFRMLPKLTNPWY